MLRAIYEQKDGSICVLTPTHEALAMFDDERAGMLAICEKDVPHNLPYWIVDESTLPTDQIEYWQLDGTQGDPDGYGGESNEFDAELLEKFKQGIIG
jgi:hypothetical protein